MAKPKADMKMMAKVEGRGKARNNINLGKKQMATAMPKGRGKKGY